MAAVAVAILLQVLPEVLRPAVHGVIDVDKATIEPGHLRTIPLANDLPWLARHIWRLPDQRLDGSAELSIFTDDDRRLGPGDSVHAEIAELGGGRYSVWSGWLYFSLPDPTTQQLRWSGRAAPRPWCPTLGGLILLLVAVLTLSRYPLRTTPTTILLLTGTFIWLAATASYIHAAWGSFVVSPDSQSYLTGWSIRSPGMYWVVQACAVVPGGINAVSSLQGLAVAAGAALVAIAAYLALHNSVGRSFAAVLAWLLCITISASDLVWEYSPRLLTEAMTGAALTSAFGALAIALNTRSRPGSISLWLLAGSILLCIALLIRTSAVLAVPIPLAMILLLKLPAWRSYTVFIVPIAMALAIQAMWSYSRHGHFSLPTMSGVALLGNVAPLARPGDSDRFPEVVAAISRHVDGHSARIDWSLDWESRSTAASDLYNTLLWAPGGALEAVNREFEKPEARPSWIDPDQVTHEQLWYAKNALANQVAWDVVKANRFMYFRFVTDHFVRLYRLSGTKQLVSIGSLRSSWDAPEAPAWPTTPPSSYERASPSTAADFLLRRIREIQTHRLVRWYVVIPASIVSIVGVIMLRRRAPPWLLFSALGFGIVACYFAGTAFYQVSLIRYVVPVLPILLSASLVFWTGVAGVVARRLVAKLGSDKVLAR